MFSNSILSDFISESLKIKARITYNRCRRAGKSELASKIACRYGLREPNDDFAIATGLAFMAMNKYKSENK